MTNSSRESLFGITLTELVIILFFIMLLAAIFNIDRITKEKKEIEDEYNILFEIRGTDGEFVIPTVKWEGLVELVWGDSENINSDLVPIAQFEKKLKEMISDNARIMEQNERLLADNNTLNDIIDDLEKDEPELADDKQSNNLGECGEGYWITSKCADHCWNINSTERKYDYLVDIGVCKSSIVVQKSIWLEKTDYDYEIVEGAKEMTDRKYMKASDLYSYLDKIKDPGFLKQPKQCFHSVNIIDLEGVSAARWDPIELGVADRVSRRPLTRPDTPNYQNIKNRFMQDICAIANNVTNQKNNSSLVDSDRGPIFERPPIQRISNEPILTEGNSKSEIIINSNTDQNIKKAELKMRSFSESLLRQCNNQLSQRRIRNEEITLEFEIKLDARGRPMDVKLTDNNPKLIGSNLSLSRLAISALKRSSYSPQTINDQSTDTILTKKLKFPENICSL